MEKLRLNPSRSPQGLLNQRTPLTGTPATKPQGLSCEGVLAQPISFERTGLSVSSRGPYSAQRSALAEVLWERGERWGLCPGSQGWVLLENHLSDGTGTTVGPGGPPNLREMALILWRPGSDGGDILMSYPMKTGQGVPLGYQAQVTALACEVQLEVRGSRAQGPPSQSERGHPTAPRPQWPQLPRAHRCGAPLPLSTLPPPGGGADQGPQGPFCSGQVPGWGSVSGSGHTCPQPGAQDPSPPPAGLLQIPSRLLPPCRQLSIYCFFFIRHAANATSCQAGARPGDMVGHTKSALLELTAQHRRHGNESLMGLDLRPVGDTGKCGGGA